MKKLLLLALLLVSCTRVNDVIDDAIHFNTRPVATKAIVDSVMLDHFGVYGQVANSANVEGGFLMRNAEFDKNGDPVGSKYYWPNADNLSDIVVTFNAYSPYKSGDLLSGDYIVVPINTADTENHDVLYAHKEVCRDTIANNERVDLRFKHSLSWIRFVARRDSAVTGVTINSIKFLSDSTSRTEATFNTTGNLKIKLSDGSISFDGIGGGNAIQFARQNVVLDTVYKSLSDTLLIPQAVPNYVEINFDIRMQNNTGDEIVYHGRTITRKVNTGKDANNTDYVANFLGGHKYVYRIYVTVDDIQFDVTVDDWDTDVFQIWDHDATAYVEHFFVGASIMPVLNTVDIMALNSLTA